MSYCNSDLSLRLSGLDPSLSRNTSSHVLLSSLTKAPSWLHTSSKNSVSTTNTILKGFGKYSSTENALVSSKNNLLDSKSRTVLTSSQPRRPSLENSWLKRKKDDSWSPSTTPTTEKRLHSEFQRQMSISSTHTLNESEVPKYRLDTFVDEAGGAQNETFSLRDLDQEGRKVHKYQTELKTSFLSTVSTSLINRPSLKDKNDLTRKMLISQASSIAQFDPEFILKTALYTRQELNIRTTTNFLLALASNMDECKNYLKKYYSDSVRLPSDWIEVTELYQTLEDKKVKTSSIPSMLRKEMVSKFASFDEYQLAKYNKKKKKPKPKKPTENKLNDDMDKEADDVILSDPEEPDVEKALFSLKRLIRLLHIKNPHQEVMALLGKKYPSSAEGFRQSGLPGTWDREKAGMRLKLPVPITWETQLAEKGNKASVWEELLDSRKLPYMAMLRNLCNLLKAKISPEHNSKVIKLLTKKETVEKSRQFPFSFYSAHKSVSALEKLNLTAEDKLESLNKIKGELYSKAKNHEGKAIKAIVYLKKLKKNYHQLDNDLLKQYREALETAIEISVEKNVNPVPGQTLVICDLICIGEKEKLREESILLGLMCLYACEGCDLKLTGSDSWQDGELMPNGLLKSVQSNLDKCALYYEKDCESFYTHHFKRLIGHYLDSMVTQEKQLDNIILLTHGETFEKTVGPQSIKSFLSKYRNTVNPSLLYVQVDITGRKRSSCSDSPLDVYLSGSSDQLLRFLAENGSEAQLAYVESIDKKYKLEPMPKSLLPAEEVQTQPLDLDLELTPRWRTVRVFISSTFRDMHGERDMLVRYVFPELRARCRAHCMHVQEVDLRWGITQEATVSRSSLELCLSEVSQCHLFVGLLGERYGAVPSQDSLPQDPQCYWVREYPAGASVTELEIYSASLSAPKTVAGKAFFYIRNNAFEVDVPDEYKSDFVSEDCQSRLRMASLKEQVRKSGLEVFDGYPCYWGGKVNDVPLLFGLEQFGQRVLDNLWNSIQKHFLQPEMVTTVAHPMTWQTSEYSNVVISLEKVTRDFKSLMENTSTEVIMVTGKTGSGKSTFLAHVHATIFTNDGFLCDMSQDGGFTDMIQVYRYLWRDVISRLSLNVPIPKQDETVLSMFWRVMAVAADKSPRGMLVLIFDGIDYLRSSQDLTLGWLPTERQKSLRIVLSCSDGSLAQHTSSGRRDSEKNITFFPLPILSLAERKSLVSSILIQNGKTLSEDPFDNQMMQLVTKTDAAYPLYLMLACRELRQFGLFENLSQKVRSLPLTLSKMIQESLNSLEKYFGKDLVSTAFSFIALSREGLAELELQMLLGAYFNAALDDMDMASMKEMFLHFSPNYLMPPIQFAALARGLREFLSATLMVIRESRLKVPFLEFGKAIHSRYTGKLTQKKMLTFHKVLAGLFMSEADPSPSHPWLSNSSEAVRSVPHHLMSSRSIPELSTTLCSLHFLYAAIRTSCAAALYREVSAFLESSQDSNITQLSSDRRFQEYLDFLKRNLFSPGMCYPVLIQEALCYPRHTFVFQDAMTLRKDMNVFVPAEEMNVDLCQRTITGFPSALMCVDSDNGCLAVGISDGTCVLLDESSGDLQHCYTGHRQAVCAVSFVAKNLLCTASLDGTLSLWHTQGGYRVSILSGHTRRVSSCCSDSDGKTVISAGWDHFIYIWNVHDGAQHSSLDNKCPVNSVTYHPSKAVIASGDWKGKVKLWDLQTLQRAAVFNGHTSSVTCTAFSMDGLFLASGSLTGEIILWSYTSGTQISRPVRHLYSVRNLIFNDLYLISAATEGTLKVWTNHWDPTNIGPPKNVQAIKILSNQLVVLACNQGTLVISSSAGKVLYSEDVGDSVTCIADFYMDSLKDLTGLVIGTHSGHVKLSNFGENDVLSPFVDVNCYQRPVSCITTCKACIYIGFNTGHLTVMNMKVDQRGPDASFNMLQAHESKITSVTILTNNRILTTGHDMSFKVWSTRKVKPHLIKAFFNSHNDWITCSAFSASNHILVTGSQDTTLKIWNMKSTPKEEHLLSGLNEPVSGVSIVRDKIVCFGASGSLGVWTDEGTLVSFFPSPHKEPIVSDCYFNEGLEDMRENGKVLDINGFMVTADTNDMFSLRQLFNLTMHQQLIGHTMPVTGCSFLSKTSVVSTSSDNSLKWWSLESSVAVNDKHSHHFGKKITAVDFSKNGRRCLSSDFGGTLVLWNVIENRLSYHCHVQHSSCLIHAAVFMNEIGTSLAYALQTKKGCVLNCNTESEAIIRKEKEWPLQHEVTSLQYSFKHGSLVYGDREGFVGVSTLDSFTSYKLSKDWILGAQCHYESKEKFYMGHINGAVELASTSFASQTAGTGKVLKLPPAPKCFITSLDVSEGGDVVTGLASGFVRIATPAGEKRIQAHKDMVTSVKLSGAYLFTASRDGTIKVWNWAGLFQVGQFRSNTCITALSVLPSQKPSKKVLFGTAAGNVQILIWTPKQ